MRSTFRLRFGLRPWSRGRDFPAQTLSGTWSRRVGFGCHPLRTAPAPVRHKGQLLHAGEVEVVRLGQQVQAGALLIDDRLAVHYARSLGFLVTPTIAIYIAAKQRGFVNSIRPKVDRLRDIGFRLAKGDYEAVLTAAGE